MEIKLMSNSNLTPYITFSELAYYKMLRLFKADVAASKEFMFIGTVEKPNPNTYFITDIALIPQEANSGAFCETDDDRYPAWLHENYPTIEQKKTVRLNGHSHVNMAVEPSGVDNSNIEKMMQYVDDFFIQLIINRKQEIKINLWDKQNGIIFNNCEYYLQISTAIVKFENSKSTVPSIYLLPELKLENFEKTESPYIFKHGSIYVDLLNNSTSIKTSLLDYTPGKPIKANVPLSDLKFINKEFKDLLKQNNFALNNSYYASIYNDLGDDYEYAYDWKPKPPKQETKKKGGKK